MLILTRRLGEKLIIGDDIVITILDVNGNQVRLGINAPKNIAVNRQEIYERILAEKGSVPSHALEKQKEVTEMEEDNVGNVDPAKTKKILEIINKRRHLTITGKP